jgi:hypothetical protein
MMFRASEMTITLRPSRSMGSNIVVESPLSYSTHYYVSIRLMIVKQSCYLFQSLV